MKEKIEEQKKIIKEQEKQISDYDNSIEKEVRVSEQKIKTATKAETKSFNRLHVRTQRFENCVSTSKRWYVN